MTDAARLLDALRRQELASFVAGAGSGCARAARCNVRAALGEAAVLPARCLPLAARKVS